MSVVKNLYTDPKTFGGGDYDSIIITDYFQGKRGGATLDFTDYGRDYIRAGHVIIKETGVEDSLKPMPINAGGTAYAALPEDHEYYGFAVNTVVAQGNAGIANGVAVRGNVNAEIGKNAGAAELGYFDLTPILSAIKAALPTFTFLGDNQ